MFPMGLGWRALARSPRRRAKLETITLMKCFSPPSFRFCSSENATEGSLLRIVASASCHHHLCLEGAPGPAWTKHILYTRSEGVSRAASPAESTQKFMSSWFAPSLFFSSSFFSFFPILSAFVFIFSLFFPLDFFMSTSWRAHTKNELSTSSSWSRRLRGGRPCRPRPRPP